MATRTKYASIKHAPERIDRALSRELRQADFSTRVVRTSAAIYRQAGESGKAHFTAYVCPTNIPDARLRASPSMIPGWKGGNRRCGRGEGPTPTAAYKKATGDMLKKMK